MKRMTTTVLLIVLTLMFIACAGGGSRTGVGVYRHHYGHGPWWGSGYYRDRVIVVPEGDLEVAATPLPSGPEQRPMPDMGMPDVGGDFGGDMGGDW
jgi:hypothetical protein